MSPQKVDTSFEMAYMSDGGHIGVLSWPEGSAGWRSIEKVGAEAALAPGLDAIKKMWSQLLPSSTEGVEALTSMDQIRYSEPRLLACEKWWIPGLLIIGDAAHFFGPETGVSSGIGLGDAHALAEAVPPEPGRPGRGVPQLRTVARARRAALRGDGPRPPAHGARGQRAGPARGALAPGRVGRRPGAQSPRRGM